MARDDFPFIVELWLIVADVHVALSLLADDVRKSPQTGKFTLTSKFASDGQSSTSSPADIESSPESK